MRELESAYFLEESQLLFLLSLIDGRTLLGFAMGGSKQWQQQEVTQIAFSLIQGGQLQYGEQGLQIAPELDSLLRSMKSANRMVAIYSKQKQFPTQMLYLGGENVSVEMVGTQEYRLHGHRGISQQWLVEYAGLPKEAAGTELLAQENPSIQACLRAWKERAVPFGESALCWAGIAQARSVMELYEQGALRKRWAWIEDPCAGSLVVQQEAGDSRVQVDTKQQRESLLREFS